MTKCYYQITFFRKRKSITTLNVIWILYEISLSRIHHIKTPKISKKFIFIQRMLIIMKLLSVCSILWFLDVIIESFDKKQNVIIRHYGHYYNQLLLLEIQKNKRVQFVEISDLYRTLYEMFYAETCPKVLFWYCH